MGVVHEEINLSSPSEIIHGQLIVLVTHKQAQLCLQSHLKCYEQISKNVFILANVLLLYLLTHSFTC